MTETSRTLQVVPQPIASMELTVAQVRAQMDKLIAVMREVMKDGVHYGAVPGTDKKTLLKPGAEILCVTFRLAPSYHAATEREDRHLTVTTTCTLTHIPTGNLVATGMGMCSTRESKYAYRKASRVCPQCKNETIIKGKAEFGGGWLCFAKKGGCGAKFKDGDQAIEGQSAGRADNEDVQDQHNTVLKMSNKRALVAAILNATGASEIFTQDMEDEEDETRPARIDPVATARKHLEAAKDSAALARAWDHPEVKAARSQATQGELQHIVNIKEKRKAELSASTESTGEDTPDSSKLDPPATSAAPKPASKIPALNLEAESLLKSLVACHADGGDGFQWWDDNGETVKKLPKPMAQHIEKEHLRLFPTRD